MKISKALIIRRLKVKESMDMADECALGCKKHNLPYEFIDGVEFMSSEDAFKSVGAKFDKDKQTETYRGRPVSDGNNNCHASHIKAWQRIVKLDEACVIFEHDTIVKGNITNIDIVEDAVNIFGHRIQDERRYNPICPIQSMVKIQNSIGGHAYGLTPKTAKWFLDDIEKNGVLTNIDEWINKGCKKPLYITDPPQVVCWPRVSTREWQIEENEHKTLGSTTTFTESYTPLCRKGYR